MASNVFDSRQDSATNEDSPASLPHRPPSAFTPSQDPAHSNCEWALNQAITDDIQFGNQGVMGFDDLLGLEFSYVQEQQELGPLQPKQSSAAKSFQSAHVPGPQMNDSHQEELREDPNSSSSPPPRKGQGEFAVVDSSHPPNISSSHPHSDRAFSPPSTNNGHPCEFCNAVFRRRCDLKYVTSALTVSVPLD